MSKEKNPGLKDNWCRSCPYDVKCSADNKSTHCRIGLDEIHKGHGYWWSDASQEWVRCARW
jgi:hypothetical protein